MYWYILGTRPEFIKAWPVVTRLRLEGRKVLVLATGQHRSLAEGMPLQADVSLNCPGQEDPFLAVTQMCEALQQYANERPLPSHVIVQGDTSSALAGARFAESRQIPLLHIEAGLRSFQKDDPWPEELIRVEIDRLASLKACPTPQNLANLAREGLEHGAEVTGNPITDALRLMGCVKTTPEHVLVTLHRRESFGQDLHTCTRRLFQVARERPELRFLWPMHPNPHVYEALTDLSVPMNVLITAPLSYEAFLKALCAARCVITDSGGVVEESTTLGIPTLIARNHTERPEAVGDYATGKPRDHAVLLGRDGAGLPGALARALMAHPTPSPIFGDGYCAPRITRMLP